MTRLRAALFGATLFAALVVVSTLVISRPGKAQVPSFPVIAAVPVYGPPASSLVEILCTNNNNTGLFIPNCTSVLPDGQLGGGVYVVPAKMSLVITSVQINDLDFATDPLHVRVQPSLFSRGPNGAVRQVWFTVGGTNVYEYPAGIVLPSGYVPQAQVSIPGSEMRLRGYLSPN